MKLDHDTLTYIEKVVNTARIVSIDSIIIEEERVRGMDEERTVVLFQDKDIPDLPYGSIGLNRTDVLLSRLNLVREMNGFAVEADVDKEKGFVRGLKIKAKGTKVDYRCANPATIQAPRVINDTIIVRVQLTQETIDILAKAAAAMGNATLVTLKSDNEGVSFTLEDVNCDAFNHLFGEVIDEHFTHKYPVKTLLALLKNKQDMLEFDVGQKGIIRFDMSGLGVYILPKV